MSSTSDQSFEQLRSSLENQPPAAMHSARELLWATDSKTLAVARNADGVIEVFIVGPPLSVASAELGDNLEHQTWTTSAGAELPATRILLTGDVNMPGVAAFICAELLVYGLNRDAQRAFSATEPLIVQLLRADAVGSQILTGLVGELIAIDGLTRHSRSPEWVVENWFGHAPSSRDLQLGSVGVEVKATTTSSSTHSVQGFYQVEIGHPASDVPETALHLLSVGVRWLPLRTTSGETIPSVVDGIVARLPGVAAEKFLARLRQYGGDSGRGYNHHRDRDNAHFCRPWFPTFERLYDMSDHRIRVLKGSDMAGVAHVDPASVSFRVTLPTHVHGDLNPISGIEAISRYLSR